MKGPVVCRILLLAALALANPAAGSGGPKLEGTYTHPAGAPIVLDLKPGGKAAFTLFGERFACTYKVKGDQLLLDCAPKGEKIDFTINSDGSLTGGALLGVLKKSAVAPSEHGTSDAADSADAADAAEAAREVSGIEREAQQAALAEVMKHWIKAKDGWITARTTGSSAAPIHFLRQFRDLTVDGVRSYALSDSDRLNGFEWAGEVSFKQAPCREAGEPGLILDGLAGLNVYRQRDRFTQWLDFQPEPVHVQKVNGQWQVPQDTWLVRGTRPGPADFANAGVK